MTTVAAVLFVAAAGLAGYAHGALRKVRDLYQDCDRLLGLAQGCQADAHNYRADGDRAYDDARCLLEEWTS